MAAWHLDELKAHLRSAVGELAAFIKAIDQDDRHLNVEIVVCP